MECFSTSRMYGERLWGHHLAAVVILGLSVIVPLFYVPASLATPGEHEVHKEMLHDTHQSPDGPDEYSLFMHHSSGVALMALGMLVLFDRLTRGRIPAVQLAIALIWLGIGSAMALGEIGPAAKSARQQLTIHAQNDLDFQVREVASSALVKVMAKP